MKKVINFLHNNYYRYLKFKAFYYKYLFASCGENFKLWGDCYIKNPDKIYLGKNVSINDGCYLNGLGGIGIGNNVAISAGAIIVSTGLDVESPKKQWTHINKKINIGNYVQIGAGAVILSGVEIGDNVIVGAGSVVTKSIESNCIVVGNPAKFLRKLNVKKDD